MKTATFPSLRVDPALRQAAEDMLADDESLSSFVEQAIRAQVERRQSQRDFIARGLASRDEAQRTGVYISSEQMVETLKQRLERARSKA